MSDVDDETTAEESPVLERTSLPGLFLIAAGVLNGLGGLILLQTAVQFHRMPPALLRDYIPNAQLAEVDRQGHSLEELRANFVTLFIAWGVIALVAAFPTLYGGVNMRSLNYYGLAMAGAVVAALPGVSPLGCFGPGEIVGVWALTVLMDREVRAAFRA